MIIGLLCSLPGTSWAGRDEGYTQKPLGGYLFVSPQQEGLALTAQTVIGAPRPYTVQRKDTFLDIARFFDLGYNELADAYPDTDPWAPPAGQSLTIPTVWILPQSDYQGIVLNIPEMRLYYFPQTGSAQTFRSVITLPVGIGRLNWQTPEATFTVRGKTRDPTWIIPASIRQERIRKRGWSEHRIPGGAPNNPLGKYRIELSVPSYAIHGTNNPWTIGRPTTHGCVRLYPEDIAQFFELVPIGSPGGFVYQPIKIGTRNGRVYVEVHPDLYDRVPDMWAEAQQVVEQSGYTAYVDPVLLAQAVRDQSGVPVDVAHRNIGSPQATRRREPDRHGNQKEHKYGEPPRFPSSTITSLEGVTRNRSDGNHVVSAGFGSAW